MAVIRRSEVRQRDVWWIEEERVDVFSDTTGTIGTLELLLNDTSQRIISTEKKTSRITYLLFVCLF